MAEKRRGLGRGLGALIPSAPAEEAAKPAVHEAAEEKEDAERADVADSARKSSGRPADLFFERVTEDDVSEQPRSYSSALRSGINKNVLDAQMKRVAKSADRTTGDAQPASKSASKRAVIDAGSVAVGPEPKGAAQGDSGAEVPGATSADIAGKKLRKDDASVSPEDATAAEVGSSKGADESMVEPGCAEPVSASADVERRIGSDSSQSPNKLPANKGATARFVSRETVLSDPPDHTPDLGEAELSGGDLIQVPGATFAELPLDSIHPNRKQPRVEFDGDELAELVLSIREIGVLQPVVVRPSKESGDGGYELVMGERRWRASRDAGLETIPAIIRSTLDDDLLRDALLENLHRSALNPLEEAAAYQQLLDDFGCSHDELAGRLGRSRPQISNTLRLMKLPPLVQRRVAAGVLSAGHARALLGLADPAEMEKLAQRIVTEGLSVRSTEEIVALSGGLRRASKPSTPRDGARHERLDYLATSLSDRLDTNVKITLGAKKGRVSIEFASVDDLNRIVGVLSPSAE